MSIQPDHQLGLMLSPALLVPQANVIRGTFDFININAQQTLASATAAAQRPDPSKEPQERLIQPATCKRDAGSTASDVLALVRVPRLAFSSTNRIDVWPRLGPSVRRFHASKP